MENSDLKPCWACGKNVTIGEGGHPVFPFRIACCARVEGRTKEDVTKIWNGNYGWKLLAEKEAETKAPNELLHQTHKDLNEARAKIQEQASHVRVLTDALEIIIKEVEEDNLKISTFCRLNAKSALDRVKGK